MKKEKNVLKFETIKKICLNCNHDKMWWKNGKLYCRKCDTPKLETITAKNKHGKQIVKVVTI